MIRSLLVIPRSGVAEDCLILLGVGGIDWARRVFPVDQGIPLEASRRNPRLACMTFFQRSRLMLEVRS